MPQIAAKRTIFLMALLPALFAFISPVGLRGAHAAAPAAVPQAEAASTQARAALDKARASVLQVKTLPVGSDADYSYGSGFAIGTERLIVTNYHVVSKVILEPDRYRLEFLRTDGGNGALAIIAIDVVNDLAVVRGDTGALAALSLDPIIPDKGERGFSIGFPSNQGLTVTEGIVNGLSEDFTRGVIHFSGPINAGMSGGPALTPRGQVFGVNVAYQDDSQLISFVVPASAVSALVERPRQAAAPTTAALFDDLGRQLRRYSTETIAAWPAGALPVQRIGRFSAPGKPGEFARCSAEDENDPDVLYRTTMSRCESKDEIYVDEDLSLGGWKFTHRQIRAPDFGAMRFASLEQSLLTPWDDDSTASRLYKTRWSCQDRIVALRGGPAKAVLCLRRYSRFEGLYDVNLKIATLGEPGDALISRLGIHGFGYPESMALAQRFMDAVSWAP